MTRHTLVMASFLMKTHVMGAGPTGCMVALALAHQNQRVVFELEGFLLLPRSASVFVSGLLDSSVHTNVQLGRHWL